MLLDFTKLNPKDPYQRPYGGRQPIAADSKPKRVLKAARPNLGIQAAYRRKLIAMIDEMHKSVDYWVGAAYGANEPRIAQDAAPADVLKRVMAKLVKRWQDKFDDAAEKMATYFSQDVEERSTGTLKKTLKDAGWSVKFRMTPVMNDVLKATVNQNVALIKSIPTTYLSDVEGLVQRSVQAGRDIYGLKKDLLARYDITKRRAELIARDQNNKASAAFTRARRTDLGLFKAMWLHSHGGETPRPTHVKMDRQEFDIRKGMWDPHEQAYIQPGELINCFPGEVGIQFADGVEVAYRHRYCGELTEIITDSGKSLRATPNHPILTTNGWVGAGSLQEGDYVVEISDNIFPTKARSMMGKKNVNYTVPSIAKIFHTINVAGFVKIAKGAYFHGDVAKGNVDVVFATRPLSFGFKPSRFQSIFNFNFAMSYWTHFCLRSFLSCGERIGLASSHFMSFLCKSLAPNYAFVGHSDIASFASSPRRTAGFYDAGHNSASIDVMFFGEGQDADPTFVLPTKLARIIKSKQLSFDGHVFNLQTKSGWYVAGGIITHNCRCVSRPILEGFD